MNRTESSESLPASKAESDSCVKSINKHLTATIRIRIRIVMNGCDDVVSEKGEASSRVTTPPPFSPSATDSADSSDICFTSSASGSSSGSSCSSFSDAGEGTVSDDDQDNQQHGSAAPASTDPTQRAQKEDRHDATSCRKSRLDPCDPNPLQHHENVHRAVRYHPTTLLPQRKLTVRCTAIMDAPTNRGVFASPLTALPVDVMRCILDYVPIQDVLLSVTCVCASMRFMVCGSSHQLDPMYGLRRWMHELNVSSDAPGDNTPSVAQLVSRSLQAQMASQGHAAPVTGACPTLETSLRALLYVSRRPLGVTPFLPPGGDGRLVVQAFDDQIREMVRSPNLEIQLREAAEQTRLACETSACPLSLWQREVTAEPALMGAIAGSRMTAPRVGFGFVFPLCTTDDSDGPQTTPRYDASHMALYRWILCHMRCSNVQQYQWPTESKFAVCCTVLSPVGGAAVELRTFVSLWHSSYPRLFVKCMSNSADSSAVLPREAIASQPTAPEVYTFGYGRVEVDIAPRLRQGALQQLRRALCLEALDFPLELMWNVVIGASASLPLFAEHVPALLYYYKHRSPITAALQSMEMETPLPPQ